MTIALAEATHVNDGTITSSPFLTPSAFKETSNADVQEFRLTAYLQPI